MECPCFHPTPKKGKVDWTTQLVTRAKRLLTGAYLRLCVQLRVEIPLDGGFKREHALFQPLPLLDAVLIVRGQQSVDYLQNFLPASSGKESRAGRGGLLIRNVACPTVPSSLPLFLNSTLD